MGHNAPMERNGIQEVISPRERLAVASARRAARDGRKCHIFKNKSLFGQVVQNVGVVRYEAVGLEVLTRKLQPLKPASEPEIKFSIKPKPAVQQDPELEQFLGFLDKDIESNPQNIRPLTKTLVRQWEDLVGNVEIDLYAPLVDEEDQILA
jgi:antitoxin PrlF